MSLSPKSHFSEGCTVALCHVILLISHPSKIITRSMLQARYCHTFFPDNKIDSRAFSIHRSFPQLLLVKGSFIHYIKIFITAGQLKYTWGRVMNWKEDRTEKPKGLESSFKFTHASPDNLKQVTHKLLSFHFLKCKVRKLINE